MIAIINYGLGNIKAFSNIYNRLNIPHICVTGKEQLSDATKIILPGVGAFDHTMKMLNNSGMRDTLDEMVLEKNIPVVGVCVGMQIMACSSEEGTSEGLGWIPGVVKHFNFSSNSNAEKLPLPHMGWNNLIIEKEDPLFEGLEADPRFYFLHSYYVECEDQNNCIASAEYGISFNCIIKHNNIYGVQCHPEKSHHNGVALLKNFASI
jgi:glutamine amidotransferase